VDGGEPRAKGINFRTCEKSVEALFGAGAWARALEIVPAELRDKLHYRGIVSGGWYPIGWYRDLQSAIRSVVGGGREVPRTLGREIVRRDLGGIYRVFALLLKPETILAKAPKTFAAYFDTGAMEMLRVGERVARARWTGCRGFDENLWELTLGGCVAALESGGARDVEIVIHSGAGAQDAEAEAEARWR
jgi:hypothetical protein